MTFRELLPQISRVIKSLLLPQISGVTKSLITYAASSVLNAYTGSNLDHLCTYVAGFVLNTYMDSNLDHLCTYVAGSVLNTHTRRQSHPKWWGVTSKAKKAYIHDQPWPLKSFLQYATGKFGIICTIHVHKLLWTEYVHVAFARVIFLIKTTTAEIYFSCTNL
jgi:hypothetical protein